MKIHSELMILHFVTNFLSTAPQKRTSVQFIDMVRVNLLKIPARYADAETLSRYFYFAGRCAS